MKNFNTVIFNVKSPQNVGMITRSHVAFGGKRLIFIGYDKPWDYKKRSQGFSRKLEKICTIDFFEHPENFLEWSREKGLKNIAVEISQESHILSEFNFSDNCNIIIGNESVGIPEPFLTKCDHIVTIPQFGQVGSLNVAVSASIVLYELMRLHDIGRAKIDGHKYVENLKRPPTSS